MDELETEKSAIGQLMLAVEAAQEISRLRRRYIAALAKAEKALLNVSDGLAHVTTGNVSHNILGSQCSAKEWAKQFQVEREEEERLSSTL